MVTRILSGKSIRGLLNYNEYKVLSGDAALILANRFGVDIDRLDTRAKLTRFENLTRLNQKAKTNALHIMLNFDRSDSLDTGKLQKIAVIFMDKIGFGDQPFLVYHHTDASHPHLHIVTTNIRAGGDRMSIHNIGKTVGEVARLQIESEFGLTKAQGREVCLDHIINPYKLKKAIYGERPTKSTIYNIVSAVLREYAFTSFSEYNAVLKDFNVLADRGKAGSLMFEKRGLIYSILDQQGDRIGVPVKASALAGKPVLNKIEQKFTRNREKRKSGKEALIAAIRGVWNKYDLLSRATFSSELNSVGISVRFHENDSGFTYGLTFIDHNNKNVFNGSDLGKSYSAKAVMEKMGAVDRLRALYKKKYLSAPFQTSYLQKVSALKPDDFHTGGKPQADPRVPFTGNKKKGKKKKKNIQKLPEQGQGI